VKQEKPELDQAENFSKSFIRFKWRWISIFDCQFRSKYPKCRAFDFLFVSKQNDSDFAKTDDTLRQISIENAEYSQLSRSRVQRHFDELTQYISDSSQRDAFAKR
jgi:type I restriction enzyme M protein